MKAKYICGLAIGVVSSAIAVLSGCEEIPDGYIPDKVIYVQNPFVIQQGVEITTAPPNINGASYPLKFKLLATEGPDGQMTTILTDSIPTKVWTKPYDYTTDKTIEDVNAKTKIVKAPVMRISESGGQISFSSASTAIPVGKYKVSVEMTNSAGVRTYKDVFVADLQGTKGYEAGAEGSTWNTQVGSWGAAENAGKYDFKRDPKGENEIEFIVCDKNDSPFSWKDGEIINRGTERSKLEDVCFDTPVYTERAAIYKYPYAPFPFAPGAKEGYTYSYRLLEKYVVNDDPAHTGYMNMVFNFRVLVDGKWTIKVKFPTITRIPKVK